MAFNGHGIVQVLYWLGAAFVFGRLGYASRAFRARREPELLEMYRWRPEVTKNEEPPGPRLY